MATFTKRGARWRAQVFKHGVRQSKSFARKMDAIAWAAKLEEQIESGTLSAATPEPTHTFAAVMQRYYEKVSPTKRGSRWEEIRLKALAQDPIAQLNINAITTEQLGDWRDRRLETVSAGTVLREITLLTSVLEHARKEWKLLKINPIRDMLKPPQPRPRDRLPSESEIERITLALGYDSAEPVTTKSQQVAVAFLLAIETAMRAGEIMSLTWDQVDAKRRVARLDETKNGDKRDVPLSSYAVELFASLRGLDAERCFTVDNASRDALFRKAYKAAKVRGLHFHDARALALTRLSKKLDVLELARMVGHRDPSSLMVYYRESAEEIAKKLD